MKWFQHYSDSHTNLKLGKLIREKGMAGYGFFWLCCELVAQQGEGYSIPPEKFWRDSLADLSGLRSDHVARLCESLADLSLISGDSYRNEGRLYIPNMGQYSDDYSRRVRRVSEHTTDNVLLDKKRLDKTRLDDITEREGEAEKAPPAPPERQKSRKVPYGELGKVMLLPEEHAKLVERMGAGNASVLIAELDTYVASTGKRYSSHYATVLAWARRKMESHVERKSKYPVI